MQPLLTMPERFDDELTASLVRVAADPAQVRSLHEILGSFCHQSRNLLNSVKLTLYLASRVRPCGTAGSWSSVEQRYRAVEAIFDRLQSICRPMVLTPLRASFAALVDDRRTAWISTMALRGRTLTFAPPAEDVVGEFDPIRLGEGLDAFVAWRAEVVPNGQPAHLAWCEEQGQFRLDWEESASGARTVGDRVDSSTSLALPFLTRVISAHGGTLELGDGDGSRLTIRWPLTLPSGCRSGGQVSASP
jgi:hypothetical protein